MIYCWYQPSYIKLIKRVTRDVDKLVLDITSTTVDIGTSKVASVVQRQPITGGVFAVSLGMSHNIFISIIMITNHPELDYGQLVLTLFVPGNLN